MKFFKPPRAHYSFGNILPELGLDSQGLTKEEGLRASPFPPLYTEGKKAPKGPFVFLLTFLSSSLGHDVIPGALAATLGHEAALRMETTSQTEGVSVTRQTYTEL